MNDLSVAEAARRLGVATETVRRMIQAQEIQAYQVRPGVSGSAYRMSEAEVARIEERRRKSLWR